MEWAVPKGTRFPNEQHQIEPNGYNSISQTSYGPEGRGFESLRAYLQTIEIDPDQIIIEDVQESLLARGDIKLGVADYTAIEQDLRSRLEEKFGTAANERIADALAVKMVREVYEPIVKAID